LSGKARGFVPLGQWKAGGANMLQTFAPLVQLVNS